MKRKIALIVFLTAAVAAYAQEVCPGAMEQVKGRLFINGTELTSAQVLELVGSEIYSDTYEGAVKQYDTGRKLLISGVATGGFGLVGMVTGLIGLYVDGSDFFYYLTYGSAAAAAISDILLAAGVPLYCLGKGRLEWVAKDYNQNAATSRPVSLAPASQGLGLAIRF